jgi:hypothetical protein
MTPQEGTRRYSREFAGLEVPAGNAKQSRRSNAPECAAEPERESASPGYVGINSNRRNALLTLTVDFTAGETRRWEWNSEPEHLWLELRDVTLWVGARLGARRARWS